MRPIDRDSAAVMAALIGVKLVGDAIPSLSA
jgi:hypothetical protein